METTVKRVYCLYRVSTEKQADYSASEADIPVQRSVCREFCDKMSGWEIKKEYVEDGISGRKVSADKRDAIQDLKQAAVKKEFDVLLVFLFDRLGRISDETPFVLEWFVKNGVEMWSVHEGQQKIENHTDRLVNFMRFWAAEGESDKISIRTSDGMGNVVKSGHHKGGEPPYGYQLIKRGRLNKRGQEVSDRAIFEEEAYIVRLIFDKYVNEGLGSWRLTRWLNEHGYKNRKGKPWNESSIKNILKNNAYIGILRSGDSHSEVIEELITVDQATFHRAQELSSQRSHKNRKGIDSPRPLNIKGTVLLNGLVYCGHCGSRLTLTTNSSGTKNKDGVRNKTRRIRYQCYGKTRKLTQCDGQTGYTAKLLDPIVESVIKQLFAKSKGISKETVYNEVINQKLKGLKDHVAKMVRIYDKEKSDLDTLKGEIVRAITGKSPYPSETLAELIQEKEKECETLRGKVKEGEREIADQSRIVESVQDQYESLLSWANIYETASMGTKKMILACLIKRIEVKRGYEVDIEFQINFEQFKLGLKL